MRTVPKRRYDPSGKGRFPAAAARPENYHGIPAHDDRDSIIALNISETGKLRCHPSQTLSPASARNALLCAALTLGNAIRNRSAVFFPQTEAAKHKKTRTTPPAQCFERGGKRQHTQSLCKIGPTRQRIRSILFIEYQHRATCFPVEAPYARRSIAGS